MVCRPVSLYSLGGLVQQKLYNIYILLNLNRGNADGSRSVKKKKLH